VRGRNKESKLSYAAVAKNRELEELIAILNNTTVGSLADGIANNASDIDALESSVGSLAQTIATNASDIDTLQSSVSLLSMKLASLAQLFGVVFTTEGAIASQNYTTHAHAYEDDTIADTADGTGTVTHTTKNTQGVN
jgi:hypothetical protein